jgi:hypothetical protein
VFRSKGDVILNGLVSRAGETLVFIVPTAASLRAGANAVRENAGEMLLGICIFRLPTGEDKTTLSLGEIAAAVNDTEPTVETTLTLETGADGWLNLRAENTGSASAISRTDALTIDLAIPPGEVGRSVGLTGFTQSEPLCGEIETNDLQPCSPMRANVMRLTAGSWKPGSKAEAALSIEKGKASTLAAFVTIYLSDGRVSQESFDLKIPNKRETK